MDKLSKWIAEYWKENSYKYNINKHHGTWLHNVGFTIHALGKISALIPNFRKRHTHQQYTLNNQLEAKLRLKLKIYKKLIRKHQNKYGFIMDNHCDSLLYTGLFSVATNNIKITAARDSKGYWHRRDVEQPCYPNGSASTISRDMMLGLYWYLWEHKDLNLAESVLEHAKANNYVMGLGDPARLLMMPAGESLLAEICHKLGGKNRWFTRHQMQSWPKNLKGYEIHLLVQYALLRGNVLGYIDSKTLDVLEYYAYENLHNPLYTYAYSAFADGNMNRTAQLLLQEDLWPSHRLPTTKDRHNDWIISRDPGSNWLPGFGDNEHTGADFIVIAEQLLRNL